MICLDDQCSSARGASLCASLICSSRGTAESIVCLKSSSHCSIAISCLLNENYSLIALHNPPDFITRTNASLDLRCTRGRADDNHPDTHVEGAKHLSLFDVSDAPQRFKDWQHRPRAEFDLYARSLRQNPRDIFEQTAAGNVRESFNHSAVEQSLEGAQITYVRFQKRRADSFA